MQVQVFGVTYNFTNAPKFAQHGVRLRKEKWAVPNGNFDAAPVPEFVRMYLHKLGELHGALV